MLNILYLGDYTKGTTSAQRAEALKRLGHEVKIHDPKECINNILKSKWPNRFHYRTGYRWLQHKVFKWVLQLLSTIGKIDVIWVDSGEYLGKKCLEELRKTDAPIILYNHDNPTGGRDGGRFNTLVKALPFYDLCIVRREVSIGQYKEKGARNILNVLMAYDEVVHKPFNDISEVPQQFISDVAFIGTWIKGENRDQFLLKLIEQGVPISIWGSRWNKSDYYSQLEPYIKGPAIYGRDYVASIQGAKVCIGFVSRGNFDLHTGRSVEVPYIGSVLCAERTVDHERMYRDGIEAVLWSTPEECAALCKELLADDNKRQKIRLTGMEKVRQLKTGNQDMCKKALDAVLEIKNKQ